MRPPIENFGHDAEAGRDLLLCIVDSQDARAGFSSALPYGPFVCLLVWDAATETVDAIAEVIDALLLAGCVYLCTWGTDCERVHDICDWGVVEMTLGGELSDSNGDHVMTTWHDREPLDEALCFFLRSTTPAENHVERCRAGIVLTVGQDDGRMSMIRKALKDPDAFARMIESRPDTA